MHGLTSKACMQFVSPPDYTLFDFDPMQWAGPEMETDKTRTDKMLSAAASFAKIWATGDPSPAKDIMHEDVKEENLMFGGSKTGRQAFIDTINGAFKVSHAPDCLGILITSSA